MNKPTSTVTDCVKVCVTLLIVLCVGDPDLLDALIARVRCP